MTEDRKELISMIKANHKKFQPNQKWAYFFYENEKECSIVMLQEAVKRTGSFGPAIDPNDVMDITPKYSELCKMFPDGDYFNYDQYSDWVNEQVKKGAFYYSRGKEDFFVNEAFRIAAAMGRDKVILENLS